MDPTDPRLLTETGHNLESMNYLSISGPQEVSAVPPRAWRWKHEVGRWVESIEGIVPNTRACYRGHIGGLFGHFERLGFNAVSGPRAVTRGMIEAYVQDRGIAPNTRAMNIGLLRQFLTWGKNPLARHTRLWKTPKRVAIRRRWLTEGQFVVALNSARGRQRTAFLLAGMVGLRAAEICDVRVGDLQMDATDPAISPGGKRDCARRVARIGLVVRAGPLGGGDRQPPRVGAKTCVLDRQALGVAQTTISKASSPGGANTRRGLRRGVQTPRGHDERGGKLPAGAGRGAAAARRSRPRRIVGGGDGGSG